MTERLRRTDRQNKPPSGDTTILYTDNDNTLEYSWVCSHEGTNRKIRGFGELQGPNKKYRGFGELLLRAQTENIVGLESSKGPNKKNSKI